MHYKVDLIVPTYKPDKKFLALLEKIKNQTYDINKIIVMNTEKKHWDDFFSGLKVLDEFKNLEVHHLAQKDFDHGGTRGKGVALSNADIFICMTQDAVPEDEFLVEKLVNVLAENQDVAAAYAKQLPNQNCREIEKFTRKFNYPDTSVIKSKEDISRLGIKTFFCSNVCAAYNRNIFDNVGGFEKKTIFNEDMIYAGHAISKNYRIAYVAEAKVVHSHNYTNMQQLHRNFDLGVSQAQHPEVFSNISSEKEGASLVKKTTKHLFEIGKGYMIPYFYINCGFKYIGYRLGLHYNRLSYGIIIRCTDNKGFWK